MIPERVDAPDADPDILRASLSQVSQVNRWLGGDRGLRWALRPLVRSRKRLRILDVGCGDGTTLERLARWGDERGCVIGGVAVDAHPQAVRLATERLGEEGGLDVIRADAFRLPFGESAFDVSMAVLTLHHFEAGEATVVLSEMARVTREKVVVSDLERSWPAYLGARLLSWTVWRGNAYTRHDGPVSVRRGFKKRELEILGLRGGLETVRVRTHLPFRLTLGGEVPGASRDTSERSSGGSHETR